MFFSIFIISCITILQPPLILAELTEADNFLLHALNLDPENVSSVDVITVTFPRKTLESYKINGTSMKIRGPGVDFDLNLHHRDSMLVSTKTPVYLVNKNSDKSGGVEYVLQPNAMEKVGLLLEDSLHRASVLLGLNETKKFTINAIVGGKTSSSGMIIRSVPNSVIAQHLRKSRSIDDNFLDDNNDEAVDEADYEDHFNDDLNSISLRAVAVNLKYMADLGNVNIRAKREILQKTEVHEVDDDSEEEEIHYPVKSLYPKILLAADSSYHRNLSSADFVGSLEYLLVLFNTIDIYFRHLEDPIIKLHVVAITIATSPEATPYINENILTRGKSFEQFRAINEMANYFYKVRDQVPINYDIAFSLTQLRMLGNAKGASRHGGACRVSDNQMNGVVLVTDNGLFSEIEAAVHELGHVLGLPDDDVEDAKNCNDQLGRYAEFFRCSASAAYIMAPLSLKEREPTFSDTSLGAFDELLENGSLSCMYEKPVPDSVVLPESLPATVPSLAEQCQAHKKTGPCPGYEKNMCSRLRCLEPSFLYGNETLTLCVAFYHGAARGTPCKVNGDRHPGVCHHNRCVSV